ncbi:MAG: hypothetical protein AB7F43_13745 [Bacteriovoracia bacterium]
MRKFLFVFCLSVLAAQLVLATPRWLCSGLLSLAAICSTAGCVNQTNAPNSPNAQTDNTFVDEGGYFTVQSGGSQVGGRAVMQRGLNPEAKEYFDLRMKAQLFPLYQEDLISAKWPDGYGFFDEFKYASVYTFFHSGPELSSFYRELVKEITKRVKTLSGLPTNNREVSADWVIQLHQILHALENLPRLENDFKKISIVMNPDGGGSVDVDHDVMTISFDPTDIDSRIQQRLGHREQTIHYTFTNAPPMDERHIYQNALEVRIGFKHGSTSAGIGTQRLDLYFSQRRSRIERYGDSYTREEKRGLDLIHNERLSTEFSEMIANIKRSQF